MGATNHDMKAKLLLRVWIVITLIAAICCKIYMDVHGVSSFTGFNVPLEYMLVLAVFSILVFCPLLIRIRYHATKANHKKIAMFSQVTLVIFILWALLLLLEKIWTLLC